MESLKNHKSKTWQKYNTSGKIATKYQSMTKNGKNKKITTNSENLSINFKGRRNTHQM
jgi:hypothetical protein